MKAIVTPNRIYSGVAGVQGIGNLDTPGSGVPELTTFPKVGHYGTGGSVLSYLANSGWQNHWAKLNLCIIGGTPSDSRYGHITTIKALAAAAGNNYCKFIPYSAPDEWNSYFRPLVSSYVEAQTGPGGNAVDWWARSQTLARAADPPTIPEDEPGYPYGLVEVNEQFGGWKLNISDYQSESLGPRKDSQGRLPAEWAADWFYGAIYNIQNIDGIMVDLFNDRPLTSNADRDGATPYANDTNSLDVHRYAHQRGFQRFVNRWLSRRPDDIVVGNNQYSPGYPDGVRNLSGPIFEGLVNGMMEYVAGQTWSGETSGGFWNIAHSMSDTSYNSRNGFVLLQDSKPYSGEWNTVYTEAQATRYFLAFCCLCDGAFYCPDGWDGNGRDYPRKFIDEYDLAGTDFSGWLGEAVDPPILGDVDQISDGTLLARRNWGTYGYKREFQNGMVILNPYWRNLTSNNNATATIPSGYKRITGISAGTTYRTADPSWNNGTVYNGSTQVTLQPREALFLEKT